MIPPADAREIVPALFVDDLVAAIWSPTDGFAGPSEVTNGFARRARDLGARILEGVEVKALTLDGPRVRGVVTSEGTIAADVVINAAGPAARLVGRMAGLELPIRPSRRHIFFTEPFPAIPGPVPLTTDRGSGFYFRKELDRVLLSPGDQQDMGDDLSSAVDWGRTEEAVRKAIHRVPMLADATIAGGWAGLRPLTPDDHAIIGWAPGLEGHFLAVGFGGHGFQHSPATGRYVAEWLVDGQPSLDLSLFAPDRFTHSHATPTDHGPDAE